MHQDSFCRRTSITEKRHGGRRLSDDRPRPPPSRPGTFIKPMYSIRPIAATVRRFHGSLRVSSPPLSPHPPPPPSRPQSRVRGYSPRCPGRARTIHQPRTVDYRPSGGHRRIGSSSRRHPAGVAECTSAPIFRRTTPCGNAAITTVLNRSNRRRNRSAIFFRAFKALSKVRKIAGEIVLRLRGPR